MNLFVFRITAAICAVLILVGAGGLFSQSTRSQSSAADDFKLFASKDWPMAGGDSGNTRYSSLTQISTSNVKQLGGAWVSKRFEEGGSSRVAPVVKDGLMFVTAGRFVYALNAKTGETVWTYKTIPDQLPSDYSWLNSPH